MKKMTTQQLKELVRQEACWVWYARNILELELVQVKTKQKYKNRQGQECTDTTTEWVWE